MQRVEVDDHGLRTNKRHASGRANQESRVTDFLCDFAIPMLITIGVVFCAIAVVGGSIGDEKF